jgi:hypothetical protein
MAAKPSETPGILTTIINQLDEELNENPRGMPAAEGNTR